MNAFLTGVVCPTCHAPIGAPCQSVTGRPNAICGDDAASVSAGGRPATRTTPRRDGLSASR